MSGGGTGRGGDDARAVVWRERPVRVVASVQSLFHSTGTVSGDLKESQWGMHAVTEKLRFLAGQHPRLEYCSFKVRISIVVCP